MHRRTEIYDMPAGFAGLLPGEGAAVWRATAASVDPSQFAHGGGVSRSDPRDMPILEDPPPWMYEPQIISLSAQIYDASGGPGAVVPAEDTAIGLQAFFLDPEVFRPLRNANAINSRAFIDGALDSTRKIQLVSFRTSDTGRRVFYDPNFGAGHWPPREAVSESTCQDPANGYWPLVLYYNRITDDTPTTVGHFILDWQWTPRRV